MKIMNPINSVKFSLVLLLAISLPALGHAGIRSERPSQVQIETTLALGSGVALSYNLGDHLLIGANYYAASYEGEGENTDKDETYKADFSTSELYLRYYLFENSSFYFSGASVFRNWKITVTGSDYIGDSGQTANYELTAEWPTAGFAYGLGFNWIADFGLSGGLYLGVLTGGNPELKGKVDNDLISQADVDKEVDEIEKEEKFGDRYNTVSIIRLSIGYNF
jgi:hypothetical protein